MVTVLGHYRVVLQPNALSSVAESALDQIYQTLGIQCLKCLISLCPVRVGRQQCSAAAKKFTLEPTTNFMHSDNRHFDRQILLRLMGITSSIRYTGQSGVGTS